jgi:hypothetical protein
MEHNPREDSLNTDSQDIPSLLRASVPYSQEPETGIYPDPDESIAHSPTICL